jgi:hypothetical protein
MISAPRCKQPRARNEQSLRDAAGTGQRRAGEGRRAAGIGDWLILPVIVAEIFCNVGFLLFDLALRYLLFAKSHRFPRAFIAFSLARWWWWRPGYRTCWFRSG